MIEQVDDPGLEEPLESEGTEDEFCKCRKSRIKYTRALLLELTEVEVCRKLPSDFNLLVLRQLDVGSEATVELKSIIGKPFDHGPFLRTTWKLPFRDQRQDDYLCTQSKGGHLQKNCSSDGKEVCQPLPQKAEQDAGVLHREIQKCDVFQLSKTENPYRPPHLNKKMPQPLVTFPEPGVESPASGCSNRKGSADDIAGHEQSGYGLALRSADEYSTKEPVGKSEGSRRNIEGNDVIEPSKPLDDYEDFWRKNAKNVVIGANNLRIGLMEDNKPTVDEFWAEILETIHLQQEPRRISPKNSHADSDVKIYFHDEESLTSVGPDNLNSLNFDESNGAEAEISLPDEDSLITIQDMIAPYSNRSSWEADHRAASNIALDIRNSSKSTMVATRDDRSKKHHLKAKRYPDLSVLLPSSQTSMDIFVPDLHPHHLLCDQAGFFPVFSTPDILSYIPSLNIFARSDIRLSHPDTKTSNYVSQYSLSHQPNILPRRPNHLLFGDPTKNLLSTYDLDATQFLRSTSNL
ncbi:hypothetical protein AAHA92_13570 [Salvia divinorum]|uniref:Uncharacterized protein n=1 Tax=Salvia divinorum TaxID=28513 RepID=A0ABD1H8N8_SALDI